MWPEIEHRAKRVYTVFAYLALAVAVMTILTLQQMISGDFGEPERFSP